jgi:hypothetical protein
MRTVRNAITIAFVVVVASVTPVDRSVPTTVTACGPITTFPIFTPLDAPDQDDFLAGNLGILQPTYGRRYLLAAWRVLNGRPLTAEERQVFGGGRSGQFTDTSASETWREARKTVAEIPAPMVTQDTFILPTYSYIVNCSDSALVTAANTLKARRSTLGATSARFLDWVRAQDVVFSNCSRRGNEPAAIPDPLGADASPEARADRDYQIAAAHFYAGQFADAETRFLAIANEGASPWKPWGRYLAARSVIRRGTMGGPESNGDADALRQAEEMLRAIVADPQLSTTHGPARQLLDFLALRTEPVTALAAAATALDGPESAEDFRRHFGTYEFLLNRGTDDARPFSELVDWVLTMKTSGANDETADYATERWHRSSSLAWLVAALSYATATTPNREELLTAAAAVDARSPAYPTVAFHRARVLLLSGRTADARRALSDAMARPHLPLASMNALKMARLATAQTFEEFLDDAARVPIEEAYGNGGVAAGQPTLDTDVALVLNERLPLAVLRRAAASIILPRPVRREVLLATFVRAMLLDRMATVRALVPDVSRQVPSLAAALKPLASTRDDKSLRDEVALLLLRHPGLRPFYATGRSRTGTLTALDHLRDNWWCSYSSTEWPITPYETRYWHGSLEEPAQTIYQGAASMPSPSFLTAAERRTAETEMEQLKRLDTGPNEIGRRVLAWARAHPTDPRVPEMLHRVVRATRYACTNDRTGAVSKDAFTLLHRRYPKSPWAAKTPLWFK